MEQYLSPEEAAKILRCSRRFVYDLLAEGRLQGFAPSGRWYITPADIDAYVKSGRRGPGRPLGARNKVSGADPQSPDLSRSAPIADPEAGRPSPTPRISEINKARSQNQLKQPIPDKRKPQKQFKLGGR